MMGDVERFLKLVRAEPAAERAAREILLKFRSVQARQRSIARRSGRFLAARDIRRKVAPAK